MCPSLETSLTENVNREKGNLRKLQQNEKGNIANLRMKFFFPVYHHCCYYFKVCGFFWLVGLVSWLGRGRLLLLFLFCFVSLFGLWFCLVGLAFYSKIYVY